MTDDAPLFSPRARLAADLWASASAAGWPRMVFPWRTILAGAREWGIWLETASVDEISEATKALKSLERT